MMILRVKQKDKQQTFDANRHFINRFNGHNIVIDFNSFYLKLLVTNVKQDISLSDHIDLYSKQ